MKAEEIAEKAKGQLQMLLDTINIAYVEGIKVEFALALDPVTKHQTIKYFEVWELKYGSKK